MNEIEVYANPNSEPIEIVEEINIGNFAEMHDGKGGDDDE